MATGVAEQLSVPATRRRAEPAEWKLYLLALGVIAVSFALFFARPYSLVSDLGFEAFSAKQFVEGAAPAFDTIRLADIHDLSRDATGHLDMWSPCWTFLFVITYKLGLAPGDAGRLLGLIMSIAGALGWVRVTRALGLKGWWRAAGVILSSSYCLRNYWMTLMGTGDPVIYAVAPWLILAGKVATDFQPVERDERREREVPSRLVLQTAAFSLLLGSIYWLKYTGIFLSFAILLAITWPQLRHIARKRPFTAAAILALYAATFVTPALALKAMHYRASGSDALETAAKRSPKRDLTRLAGFIYEGASYAASVLFSAQTWSTKIAGDQFSLAGWLIRIPGLILLAASLIILLARPPDYLRNVALLACALPVFALPLMSFAAGPHFSNAMPRGCGPYWLLIELMILVIAAETGRHNLSIARAAMIATAAFQLAMMLAIPIEDVKESNYIFHSPAWRYKTSPAKLWDTDLSKHGTRDIVANVHSLVRSPQDVIVAATSSERAYESDTLIEFGGRLLPLTVRFPLLTETLGSTAYNYYADSPIRSSKPLRVILVAADPYERPDFHPSVAHIMQRFDQVTRWTPGPPDPYGRTYIWTGEIR